MGDHKLGFLVQGSRQMVLAKKKIEKLKHVEVAISELCAVGMPAWRAHASGRRDAKKKQ